MLRRNICLVCSSGQYWVGQEYTGDLYNTRSLHLLHWHHPVWRILSIVCSHHLVIAVGGVVWMEMTRDRPIEVVGARPHGRIEMQLRNATMSI